jgi:hypothetical protein
MRHKISRHPLQIAVAAFFVTLWRLSPFRPPNVEPLLATSMPFGKRYGVLAPTILAVLAIVGYDAITSGLTQWTAVTAVAYALIAAGSGFLKGTRGVLPYLAYAILATLVYDALTGVVAGAVLFDMGWKQGFLGQIPFTINHLIGNAILALVLSPIVEWVIRWSEQEVSVPAARTLRRW